MAQTPWLRFVVEIEPMELEPVKLLLLLFTRAGIPQDRHGHRHRHGHPRRLPREDRREDLGVSGDFPVQLATNRTRTTILADLSADLSDTRAFPREDVR